MNCPLNFDSDAIFEAARAASDIYLTQEKTDFTYRRTVEQFSRLTGELAAGVRYIDEGRTAIVAVRGTSLIGNWVFTNFQTHFTQFSIVDDRLSAAPTTPYQGGSYRTPIAGALHQGFFRAFSWLWYGTEPILGNTEPSQRIGVSRLKRYVALFLVVPLLLWLATGSLATAACIALALAFIFVTTESGVWEDVFKQRPEIAGDDPYRLLAPLNSCERVIFTGHSLGGAIAAIAFAMYRSWCKGDNDRKDNAMLVTFGAPRIGDVPFMEDFSSVHSGRFCHVIHPGDPVPELPPNGLFELWYRRIWTRGILGLIVVLLFPIWAAIGKLYVANRAARWTAGGQCVLRGSPTLAFSNHSMQDVYLAWANAQRQPR
jgi:hypothetical protein